MPKENTLFAYFSKSPKVNQASNKATNGRPAGANGKGGTTPATPLKRKEKCSDDSELSSKVCCGYKLHDIVWAKLEGYPYWPAMVCNPPNENSFLDRRKQPSVHVQFFDTPPSRGWIKSTRLKTFTGPDHMEIPKMKDATWIKGVEEAVKALAMPAGERSQLIVFLEADPVGDDENGMEDEEDDKDHSDEECEDSKENNGSHGKLSRKRRRIILPSDSEGSDDEFQPTKHEESDSDSASSGVDENMVSEPEPESAEESPVKGTSKSNKRKRNDRKVTSTPSQILNSPSNEATRSKLLNFASPKAPAKRDVPECTLPSQMKSWAHLSYDFLKDGKRRDAAGHLPGHPDFCSHTLSIPMSFKEKQTPAMRQWWDMKSQHFDVVLFFKVGKFYELYHMDAVIGVEELGLVFMKGEFAHSGFPEISYGRYSETLIQKGYKVARVEQTENPQMMEERCKKMHHRTTKFDKVVKREICRITSKATRMYSVHDGQVCDAEPSFLFAFAEKSQEVDGSGGSEFGVCFVDTSVGTFHLGQFKDDHFCSKLRTTVSHYAPAEVLFENNGLTTKARQVLDGPLCSVAKQGLRPWKEFWDAQKTLKCIREGAYFEGEDGTPNYPKALVHFIDPDDTMMLTPKDDGVLALKALGACIWYLSESLIEEEVLTMRSFQVYTPQETSMDRKNRTKPSQDSKLTLKNMIVDGVSLQNLEILRNSSGGHDGTLLATMDFCSTQFGKRLFLQWLCSPSCQASAIEDRQRAVEDLLHFPNEVRDICKVLKSLPDLERLLTRIHGQGLARKDKSHPDHRAILYEDTTYNKRKIGNLLLALQGFETAMEVVSTLTKFKDSFASVSLVRCSSTVNDGGDFPNLKEGLSFFENAFDHEQAKKEGRVTPSKGVDADYDDAMQRVKAANRDLDDYLETQCRHFRCKATYVGSGKNRFQIEVPESAAKLADSGYELQGQRKGYRRYWTPKVKRLAAVLVQAEEAQEAAVKDIMRRIFESFDQRRGDWAAALKCLAILDCLLSLAQYSASLSGVSCMPRILKDGEPRLSIKGGRHPCLLNHLGGDNMIPNDISLGDYDDGSTASNGARLAIITGPNMGGKSTLMRQAGLLVIIAQMGAKVPAESCELTLVDRIFTRLGASDRINSGESTFFVEVNETSAILRHATCHSLVLLDELGRGTSTHDGMSIAHAVVAELSTQIRCRTLFSTHYHHLVNAFTSDRNIFLGHMACMVENENDEDPTQETIVFLYKFAQGACPKSYGFNAAKLAGIPVDIIKRAFEKSKHLESKAGRQL